MLGGLPEAPFDAAAARRRLWRIRSYRVVGLLLVLLAVAPVLFPTLAFHADDRGLPTPLYGPVVASDAGRWRIVAYDVAADLATSGRLRVVERLEVEWRVPRRGFQRDLLLGDGVSAPSDPVVTSPTFPGVRSSVFRSDGMLAVVVGGEEVRPAGLRDVFIIEYELDGLVVRDSAVPTLRWDTVGFGWSTTMRDLRVRLTSEVPFRSAACAFGWDGESRPCTSSHSSGSEVVWSAPLVPVGFGITGQVTFPEGSFPDAPPAVLQRFESEDGGVAVRRVLALLLLSAALYAVVRSFRLSGPERAGLLELSTVPLSYTPPSGLTPVAGAALLSGWVGRLRGPVEGLRLLDMAARGVVLFDPPGPDGSVRVVRGPGSPRDGAETEIVERMVAEGRWRPGSAAVSLSALMRRADDEEVRAAFRAFPAVGGAFPFGVWAVVAALMTLFAVAYEVSELPVFVAAYGAYALSTRRAVGEAVRSAVVEAGGEDLAMFRSVAGFRRFLAEAQVEQLESVSSDPAVPFSSAFLEFLPWAAAFGLADGWSERFGSEVRRDASALYGSSGPLPLSLDGVRAVSSVFGAASGSGSGAFTAGAAGRRGTSSRRGGGSGPRSGARSGRGGGGGRSR